jgi:RimJ/RimL family protein N-acetyltransferase
MTILSSERLRLEPFDAGHFDGLQALNRDPEVMRYIGGEPETPEQTRAMIARVQGRWVTFGYSWWSLIEHESGLLVGAAGLQHLGHERANPHEIGWRLRRDRWGRGLALEAARTVLAHAFGTVGAPRVCAIRHPDNLASQRVMERLGMRHVGRQAWNGDQVEVHELERAAWQAGAHVVAER